MAPREALPQYLLEPARRQIDEFKRLAAATGLTSTPAYDVDDPKHVGNKDPRYDSALEQAAREKGLSYDKNRKRIEVRSAAKGAAR